MSIESESFISMLYVVRDYQSNYVTITNALPNFPSNYTLLLNTMTQIQGITEQLKMSKSGFAEVKNQLRATVVTLAADNLRKLGVYAKFTNNTVLAKEVNISESKLKQSADTELKDYAQLAYDKAQPIVASLASYGITAQSQLTLLNNITSYNAIIGKPMASKADVKVLNKQLEGLIKSAKATLANLDAAVEIVRLSQPLFYSGYKTARKVIETGAGSLALQGLVSDATSGEPIKGVTVVFEPQATAGLKSASAVEPVVKKSAEKGGFYIKSMPDGVYTVRLTKPGYAEQVETVTVAQGEMTVLNVKLMKN